MDIEYDFVYVACSSVVCSVMCNITVSILILYLSIVVYLSEPGIFLSQSFCGLVSCPVVVGHCCFCVIIL